MLHKHLFVLLPLVFSSAQSLANYSCISKEVQLQTADYMQDDLNKKIFLTDKGHALTFFGKLDLASDPLLEDESEVSIQLFEESLEPAGTLKIIKTVFQNCGRRICFPGDTAKTMVTAELSLHGAESIYLNCHEVP